ncbi:A disintegrin and metalloproteinase with thrombospondin motifs 7 isoform X2 [Zophobas morio]|uniref:A disintegrin and metalloproteinase with thrombospondin motifs 7 isoform X2 n=1 Tax=Zophobas morio TaxID=2755281 RepID=UPI0030835BB6
MWTPPKPCKWHWVSFLVFFATCATNADKIYTGLYSGALSSEAHETIPRKVSPNGDYISHNLTSFHDDGQVHFNISLHDREHLLILEPVRNFLAPALVVERRKRDTHSRSKPSDKSKNCHFQGIVHGQPNSRVAVSACNGLTGMLHTEHGKYYIEPSHHLIKQIDPGHPHLVYKRSTVVSGNAKKKKRKKRKKHFRDCGTREPKKMAELEWQKQLGKVKVQEKKHKNKHKIDIPSVHQSQMKKHKYKKVDGRQRRSVSTPQYVETLLVADPTMVEFHEDGDIETYLLTIMNMVSSLYMDPSIGNLIKVVVVKIILIDDVLSEPELNVSVNADQTLKNFCKWQKNLNPGNDSHPHHHDVAILITRKDICARQNAPCNTLGVAHVAGMCKSSRSCSVNEDNGITLAHTIAHEMGHNKGLGQCLQDEPEDNEIYEYPELPPGAMYNADYQCRFQFGGDATVCSPLDEICFRLWCMVNDTCTTQLRPAAPGTYCGKHKWCQDQKCLPIMEPPVAIDGGWGEWSSWSECSRTCGAGVSVTQRECDHPTPTAGGRFCIGERRRYRICNTDSCPDNKPTFRAVQCSTYNNRTYEGKKYEWQPYFDQDEPCQLYCSDANETVIVPWGEYAVDGTPCNVGSRDVCISGICRKVGCDWVVDSTAHEDDCGICQGDGTKCDKIEGLYNKQSYSPGYREVVVIPAGARNIRIEEKDHSENYISIGSALAKKFYLNGKRHITLPGEYTVAGAQALYERDNQLEKIRIPGPIREPIVVYVIFRGKIHNPGVEYKYSIWKRQTTQQVKYSWIMGDWSQCSATCGGGVQDRKPLCQESTVGEVPSVVDGASRIVDELMCESSERPEEWAKTCNDDPCPTHWWVGPWQSCPVTCAKTNETPMKRRSVMCVDGQEMALPDRFCDKNAKPLEYSSCRILPEC